MSIKVLEFLPNFVAPGNLNWDLTFSFNLSLGEYFTGDGLSKPVVLKRSCAFEKAFDGELANRELMEALPTVSLVLK